MAFLIHNTLTGRKEQFIPLEPGKVKIYVCGPTVYDHSHVGHARAVVVFDVLIRHLKYLGYEVTYVRNFTDLDDKIIARAREENTDFLALAERYIKSFHEDMDALGALRPDVEPRATHFIDLMIADVAALVQTGAAYQVDGDVYYDVSKFLDYGRLSGRNIEEMMAGARIEVDERKRGPWDFVLWKASKSGEPSWPSPWGPGRPGWHIECSTMSRRLLGDEFDIHGGGHDLIFPHHENELAQSAALGRKFAHYWMHNGFVRVDNQKMSKSLKNFFTVKEVLAGCDPEVLRLFLLSKHYRGPIEFSEEGLAETRRSLDRAYQALRGAAESSPGMIDDTDGRDTAAVWTGFVEAMNDDLNTARALGCLFEAVKELNRLVDQGRLDGPDSTGIGRWRSTITGMGRILGLLDRDPEEWFSRGVTSGGKAEEKASSPETGGDGLTREKIEALIQLRAEARRKKDWAEADRIRGELKARGVVLEDAGGQTRWRWGD
ncbi:MAG: cysteine--tRNA ligase [Thermodesulfobacteriota bacterium]